MSDENYVVEVEVIQIATYEVEVETSSPEKAEKLVFDGHIPCDPYDGAELTDMQYEYVMRVNKVFTRKYGISAIADSDVTEQ